MRVVWLTAFVFALSCTSQIDGYESEPNGASAEKRDSGAARAQGAEADAGATLSKGSDAARPDAGSATEDVNSRRDAGRATAPASSALGCADEARWIYAIANTGTLLRYEPDANTLTEVGTLDCPTAQSPFSMAVNRDAVAYVLHADRKIYEVDTSTALCRATSYVPATQGFETFGMGFVSDTPGSDSETLFIAGGRSDGLLGAKLGALDPASWGATVFGALEGSAELSGNANAELWAFIADASPLVVRQLDKNTGATLREFDVSRVDRGGSASAWAFAYWGGRYYIFYESTLDDSTSISRLTPEQNVVEPVYEDTGYSIVGAGVSTCAPTALL